MDIMWFLVLVVVLLAIGIAAWAYAQQRQKREALRDRFGPEYERTVDDFGSRGRAEKELSARTERIEQLHIRPLARDASARYAEEWRTVQSRFVDDPETAIGDADRLITEVLQERGYPVGDFEQQAADISVQHAGVVEHYRAAHAIAVRVPRHEVTTEDMREAMLHYRALFDDLVEPQSVTQKEERHDSAA